MSQLTHSQLEEYILSLPGAWLDYPFGEQAAVYKVGHKDIPGQKERMFALIAEGTNPVRVSLKCDPAYSLALQERHSSVSPGYHLNKKHWITIACDGQLAECEVQELIRMSYMLVTKQPGAIKNNYGDGNDS